MIVIYININSQKMYIFHQKCGSQFFFNIHIKVYNSTIENKNKFKLIVLINVCFCKDFNNYLQYKTIKSLTVEINQ